MSARSNPKSRNRVYVVHRLDKDTSGVLIFAKSEQAKKFLQGNWGSTEKHYLAIVHGRLTAKEGTISSYLVENKAQRVYSTNDATKGSSLIRPTKFQKSLKSSAWLMSILSLAASTRFAYTLRKRAILSSVTGNTRIRTSVHHGSPYMPDQFLSPTPSPIS